MNIIVIGANGFIGSHCLAHFSLRHRVDAFSRNDDLIRAFSKTEYNVCINASGSANVGFSLQAPETDFELNVANVQRILAAIRLTRQNCKLINFSSAAVYGNPAKLPVSEQDALQPLSPYGYHKLQSELLLKEYHDCFHLKTCSLRIFSAYGPGLRKQIFWDLYQKVKSAPQQIELDGTGNESRDFIFVTDLMSAIETIIDRGKFAGEAINIASGIETRVAEAVRIFLEAFSPDTQVSYSGLTRPGDPQCWHADMSVLAAMGFQPKINLTTGLMAYTRWLQEIA